MADRRAAFRGNVAKVEADDRRASDVLMRRLKSLTPSQFLREPPRIFDKISVRQYKEVVATIAPEVQIPEPAQVAVDSLGFFEWLAEFWKTSGALARSFYVTAAATFAITLLLLSLGPELAWKLGPYTLARFYDTNTWPTCAELAWDTDGCIYEPHEAMYWEWAALQTQIDVAALRRLNPDLPEAYIPAGKPIIIWRGRGQLLRSPQ
jgi:hypothetical protein